MFFEVDFTIYENFKYPIHEHEHYEIIVYTKGSGEVFVNGKVNKIKEGNILIVPPFVKHGSISVNGLESIYVSGDFSNIFNFSEPIIMLNEGNTEGVTLAKLILNNRYGKEEYLDSLIKSLIQYILINLVVDDEITNAVKKIVFTISQNFCDSDINLNDLLNQSGYAEDYIRAHFKRVTGKTPNAFLTEMRINHAKKMIKIYKNALSLSDVSLICGYTDYVYFSRKFREVEGVSPKEFKNKVLS